MKTALGGPEQVFRVHSSGGVANFGVAVLSHATGVTVTPRIVYAGDENHLAGYTALPFALNPYQSDLRRARARVRRRCCPTAGDYDVVFDTPTGARPGAFSFRYWVNDHTPPAVALRRRARATAATGLPLSVTDAGSGRRSLDACTRPSTASRARSRFVGGRARDRAQGLVRPGTHKVTVVVSDVQESKNMEDVPRILPNTTTFTRDLPRHALGAVVIVVERRQPLEVALDARDELVGLALQQLQARLAAGALPPATRLDAEALL